MLHQFGNNSTSFSIFFPMSGSKQAAIDQEAGSYSSSSYYNTTSSSSSSVDCTLSLGPPSSSSAAPPPPHPQRCAAVPSFCWDQIISQSKASHPPSASAASRLPAQNNIAASSMQGGDPLLLARRCANCDTVSTPLWRNGPRGPKSLCNACGIRYKKEERRAAASTATPLSSSAASTATPLSSAAAAIGYSNQRQQQQNNNSSSSWGCYNANSTAAAAAADDDMDQVPYLSWRLNVVPQPTTLFQYQ